MKKYLIIDIGTSSLRVSVVNEKLGIDRCETLKRIADICFDAEAEWNNIKGMIAKVVQSDEEYVIVASALLGWVGVGSDSMAVTPCYSYMHQCQAECEAFRMNHTNEEVFPINGRCISPELAGFKIAHLKEQEPEVYDKLLTFTSLKDYVNAKLAGCLAIDHTSACYTMLYDINHADWNSQLVSALGIDMEKLPKLVRPYEMLGRIKPELAEELGISADTQIAAGSVDGSTGILGAGGMKAGKAVSVMGTTDVLFMVEDHLVDDKTQSLVINPHVFPGLWLIGGPMGMYGGTIDWYSRDILKGNLSLVDLNILAQDVPAGSDGVKVFPCLAGERTPFWNAKMRGTIWGLEIKHRTEHVFRAMLEANGYAVRRIAEIGEMAGARFDEVIAIGGGSKSNLWLQMKADIMGKPFVKSTIEEATMMGACLLAMLAAGVRTEELPKIVMADRYPVQEETRRIYEDQYTSYMDLHDKVSDIYKNN